MQSYFVYIIYSLSGDCYYRGFSENPLHRLEQHRNGESRYTSKFCDWNLVALIHTALIRNQELNVLMQEIEVSKNEVRKAKGEILPTAGFNAFSPRVWFNPESILLNLVGDLVAPLINQNALRANYYGANARQNQAVFEYERSVLNARTLKLSINCRK